MKVKATTIKKVIKHDSMLFDAKFPSGAQITWSITRSGERLSLALSNDPAVFKYQAKIIKSYIDRLEGTNEEKFSELVTEKLLDQNRYAIRQ